MIWFRAKKYGSLGCHQKGKHQLLLGMGVHLSHKARMYPSMYFMEVCKRLVKSSCPTLRPPKVSDKTKKGYNNHLNNQW